MARRESIAAIPYRASMDRIRAQLHTGCYVCGAANNRGLSLDFRLIKDGAVEAGFICDKQFEGYSGYVHGGIVSTLLDGAMTNCMFALGRAPLTAELRVRFHHPLVVSQSATVRAWLSTQTPPLYALEAEIVQEDLIKARAWGKFLDRLRN